MDKIVTYKAYNTISVVATQAEADQLQKLLGSFSDCFPAFVFELLDRTELGPGEIGFGLPYYHFYYDFQIVDSSAHIVSETEKAFALMAGYSETLRAADLHFATSVTFEDSLFAE